MTHRLTCEHRLFGRATGLGVLVVAVATLVAVNAVPADAGQPVRPSTAPAPAITHPDEDFAGAQIAKHEGVSGPSASPQSSAPAGLDVSGHQGNVGWSAVAGGGAAFAYVKATEGTTYTSPYFEQQYDGSYGSGLVRGAYHFATPDTSDGASQANYFVDHGGAWSPDGRTLPPAVDLEYNPYGQTCYNLSPAAMVAWVHAFVNQVHARTGVWPTIYTSTSWWSQCTGNDGGFGADPLWIPRYGSSVGALPAGWGSQVFWQFADSGTFPGDQDTFNGDSSGLHGFAATG